MTKLLLISVVAGLGAKAVGSLSDHIMAFFVVDAKE